MTAEESSAYAVVTQQESDDMPQEDVEGVFANDLEIEKNHSVWKSSSAVLVMVGMFGLGILLGSLGTALVLRKHHTKSVTLESSSSSDDSSDSSKENLSVSYEFLKTARGAALLTELKHDLDNSGVETMLEKVNDLLDTDSQVASSCHPLTHQLGRYAFQTLEFDGAWGNLVGTDQAWLLRICNAAYMHGIIEHYLMESTDLQSDVSLLDTTICQNLKNVKSGAWECHHGIGHGVLQYYRMLGDVQTLQQALDTCHATSFGHDCENGLWMDHFATTRIGGSGTLEPTSLQVCATMASHSWDCTIYSPTEFLLRNPRSYQEAICFCNDGLEGNSNLANTCVQGVGMQAAKENLQDYVVVEDACVTAPTQGQQESCFQEALSYYSMTTGLPKVPRSLCEPLKVYQELCRRHSD